MPYWMTHPKHGEMPVYDTGEVERAQGHGWSLLNIGNSPQRIKPDAYLPAQTPVVQEVAEPVKARKKPGPKPKAK